MRESRPRHYFPFESAYSSLAVNVKQNNRSFLFGKKQTNEKLDNKIPRGAAFIYQSADKAALGAFTRIVLKVENLISQQLRHLGSINRKKRCQDCYCLPSVGTLLCVYFKIYDFILDIFEQGKILANDFSRSQNAM